ncbi:hypothetical protein [Citrifermentans bremense]|uniref:hypothetical protein n=1 Tax=Citrifermentans bremense TaxID=60035 RepID=UPI0004796256|nr:hypothetical protein [Citrifermentans bremense]
MDKSEEKNKGGQEQLELVPETPPAKKSPGRPKKNPAGGVRKPGRPAKEEAVPSVIHIKLPQSQYNALIYLRDELRIATTTSELVRTAVDRLIVDMSRKHGSLEKRPAGKKLDAVQQRIAGIQQMLLEAQIWMGDNGKFVCDKLDRAGRSLRDAVYATEDWRLLNVFDAARTLKSLMDELPPNNDLGQKIYQRIEPIFLEARRLEHLLEQQLEMDEGLDKGLLR